jgi:hydroxyethylthiazole kinase-like uncharacterized protein yjeF
MKLLSRQQWKDWDQYTVENEPVAYLDLMERAASACTQWIIDKNLLRKHFYIFCGKGNNGGDGLAMARQLIDIRSEISVYIIESDAEASAAFSENLSRLEKLTTNINVIEEGSQLPVINKDDIIIDAIFGAGLNRPVENVSKTIIEFINRQEAFTISIDVPGGLPIETAPGNIVVEADVTLTFEAIKLCFLFAENQKYVGKVEVLPINLNRDFLDLVDSGDYLYEVIDAEFVGKFYKARSEFSHKGNHGHALLIAGSEGKSGAALIAAKACLRSGTGLLTCAFPKEIISELLIALPEAMHVKPKAAEIDLSKYSAIGIGPGLSTGSKAEKIMDHIIAHINQSMVIDADGLNIISKDPARLAALPLQTILTPHPKEFDRLFGASFNTYERIEKALNATKEYGIIIVLKDHHSMIAANGKGYFNVNGNAGLAKGGSGDALTGIITALLAQKYEPFHAATLGVYLHGMAADIALAFQSHESMLVSDVIESIGHAFKRLNKK